MTQLRSQHEREDDRTEELIARLDDAQGMAELVARLNRLPQREQEALALYAWADLAYEEIAEALGVPVGTVRSRIARGRERLTLAGGGWSDINRSVSEGSAHVDQ